MAADFLSRRLTPFNATGRACTTNQTIPDLHGAVVQLPQVSDIGRGGANAPRQ